MEAGQQLELKRGLILVWGIKQLYSFTELNLCIAEASFKSHDLCFLLNRFHKRDKEVPPGFHPFAVKTEISIKSSKLINNLKILKIFKMTTDFLQIWAKTHSVMVLAKALFNSWWWTWLELSQKVIIIVSALCLHFTNSSRHKKNQAFQDFKTKQGQTKHQICILEKSKSSNTKKVTNVWPVSSPTVQEQRWCVKELLGIPTIEHLWWQWSLVLRSLCCLGIVFWCNLPLKVITCKPYCITAYQLHKIYIIC